MKAFYITLVVLLAVSWLCLLWVQVIIDKDCAAPINPCPAGYVNIQERGEAKCVQESGVRGWSKEDTHE